MKKYILLIAASLISSMAFAQAILPDNVTGGTVSWEVPVYNSETVSGEINIHLPFDPSEVEPPLLNSANDYELPHYTLNSATNVPTGPESIVFVMLAAILGAGIYTYRLHAQEE